MFASYYLIALNLVVAYESVILQDLAKVDAAQESKPQMIMQAHGNDIVCAAISPDGEWIATASTQVLTFMVLYCICKGHHILNCHLFHSVLPEAYNPLYL